MLAHTQRTYINRMAAGESLVRIGSVWYGADRHTTVNGIYEYSDKAIQALQPIRTEAALSFSTSKPPIDTIQLELIINYSTYRSKIQRLFAHSLISPVVPVMNPVIAAITQPFELNRDLYAAYGFIEQANEQFTETQLMKSYSSVPLQMKIDNIQLSTIPDHPRDLRVIVRMVRVLTVNTYGDRTLYVETMDGAIAQESFLHDINRLGGDNKQIDAMANMFGIDTGAIRNVMDMMASMTESAPATAALPVTFIEAVDIDVIRVKRDDGTEMIVKLFGVESPVSRNFMHTAQQTAIQNGLSASTPFVNYQSLTETVLPPASVYGTRLEVVPRGPAFLYYFWPAVTAAVVTDLSTGDNLSISLLEQGLVYPATTYVSYTDEATRTRYNEIAGPDAVDAGKLAWQMKNNIVHATERH